MLTAQLKQDIIGTLSTGDRNSLAMVYGGVKYAIAKNIPFGSDMQVSDNQELLQYVTDYLQKQGVSQADLNAISANVDSAVATENYSKAKEAYEAVRNARLSKNKMITNVVVIAGVLVLGYFALKHFKIIK